MILNCSSKLKPPQLAKVFSTVKIVILILNLKIVDLDWNIII